MANIVFRADTMSLLGGTTRYRYTGGSGDPVLNIFCSVRGALILGHPEGASNRILRASSLDDPGLFEPTIVVFSDGARPWDHLGAQAPCFTESGRSLESGAKP